MLATLVNALARFVCIDLKINGIFVWGLTAVSAARFDVWMVDRFEVPDVSDFGECACAVAVSRMCR